MFDALNASVVTREVIALDTPFELVPGMMATLFAVPGKVPLYLEGKTVQTDLIGEQTVGVQLETLDRTACYVPGCALLNADLRARLEGIGLPFFDGTLWQKDGHCQKDLCPHE